MECKVSKAFMVCSVHGGLERTQVIVEKTKYKRCKLCRVEKRLKKIRLLGCVNHGMIPDDLIKKDGNCKLCHRDSANRKRNENRAEFNAKMAKHREQNPEYWDGVYKREYAKKKARYGEYLSLHKQCQARGITIEDFYRMLDEQNGVCAICLQAETASNGGGKVSRLGIDHCHKTNTVRGLLCRKCNSALGKFKDNAQLMYRAIRYIKQGGFK